MPPGPGMVRGSGKGVEVLVSVVPRSSRCEASGVQGGRLKLKLTKPPVDGQANAECCRCMAALLGISRSRVRVVRGRASRHKVLHVDGMTEAEALQKLQLA